MCVLPVLLLPLLAWVPVPDASWVGKTVLATKVGTPIHRIDETGNMVPITTLTGLGYTVLAEKNDRIQIKTRYGVAGWLEKKEVVLLDEAIPFFSRRIEQNPNDIDLYNRRSWAWKMRGENSAALGDLSTALKLRPSPALYNNRAMIWHGMKEHDKALEDFAEALRLSPRYAIALSNRGAVWHGKKDYDKAIADYSQAIQIEPKIVGAYRGRGLSWHAKKEYDRAIDDFNQALQLDPLAAAVITNRGTSRLAKKEYARAGADFDEALKLEPKNGPACIAAAMLLASCPDEKFRDGKRALELAQRAHAENKSSSAALQALAAAHAEIGDFTQAVRWQEEALRDAALAKDDKAQRRLKLYRDRQPYRSATD